MTPSFTLNDDAFVAWLALVIEHVQRPVLRDRADRPTKGKDLASHSPSLKLLMAEIAEVYIVALDDYQARRSPAKPKQRLEDNTLLEAGFDYGFHAGAGLENWDKFWSDSFDFGKLKQDGRVERRGNPSRNRTSKELIKEGQLIGPPPIQPLYPVYSLLCNWWVNIARLGPFNPTFHSEAPIDRETKKPSYNRFDYCNAAGKLFYLMIQWLDERYVLSNCNSVHDVMRHHRPLKTE